MRAVAYRLRSALRARVVGTIVLSAIVATLFGVVICVAGGAARTTDAPDRYERAYGGFDALVVQSGRNDQRVKPQGTLAAMRKLPSVESAEASTFVFGGVSRAGESIDAYTFAGSFAANGAHLIEGRAPDPNRAGEFVASPSFINASHAVLGDRFDVVTLSEEQATSGFDPSATPEGPRLTGTLVGVMDSASSIEDSSPVTMFSPALLDLPVGISQSMITVKLRPGFDVVQLRAELDTLRDGQTLQLQSGVIVGEALRTAVDAQSKGLWLLALVAAVASVAVLGQVLVRHVRIADAEKQWLGAIGLTDGQILAEAAMLAAVPITCGSVVAAGLAVIPSGLFPTGFVRRLEPRKGLQFDAGIVIGGAAVLLVALLLTVGIALALSNARSRVARPSVFVESIVTKPISPTAATGIRFAYSRIGEGRRAKGAAITGIALTVAGLVGAITFGVSLNRLVGEPFRYGVNYDVALGDSGGDQLPAGLQDTLEAEPDLATIILYADDHARVGDVSVPLVGMQPVRGDGTPVVVSGRLPRTDREVAFGLVTAHKIGAHVGDDITLAGDTGSQLMRVTGIVLVPGLGANEGVGEGGVLMSDALRLLDANFSFTTVAVRIKSGSNALDRIGAALGVEPGSNIADDPFQPAPIKNVARVRPLPFVLAALLGALVLLTLGQATMASLQRRRRDVAILRSLGASTGWTSRAIHWYSTAFTIVPVLLGIPLGLLAGRVVFAAMADSMGALNTASFPLAWSAVVLAAALLAANVAVVLPARRARTTAPAVTLKAE